MAQQKFFLIDFRLKHIKKRPEIVRTEPDLMNNEKLLNQFSLAAG